MDSDPYPLAEQVGLALRTRAWMLAIAESCTGGAIAEAVTQVPGSSKWFDRAFIVYSNVAKQEMLGINPTVLAHHGAASETIARDMALAVLTRSRSQIALAVTGIAGPDGATADMPKGTVFFAWCVKEGVPVLQTRHFAGERETVRRQAVIFALHGVLDLAVVRQA